MKKIILGICLLFAMIALNAQGLQGLVVEKYYVSTLADSIGSAALGGNLPTGSITWRFYADLQTGYKLQAVYGVDAAPTGAPTTISAGDHELLLQTTTKFFNNEDRGATSPTYSKANTTLNSVMLDSWFSVGGACTGYFGIEKASDNGVNNTVNANGILANNAAVVGIPLTTQDGLIVGAPESVSFVGLTAPQLALFDNTQQASNGNILSTYNASWASLNGSTGPDANNRILFAQITTNGVLTYNFNLQIGTPSSGVERYVASSPVGAEIAFPALRDTLNVPNICPTVSITAPTNGATYFVGNTVAVNATAADADGTVTQVQFFVNGVSIGVDATSPYSVNYTATLGTKNITAVATDDAGCAITSSIVTITVGTNAAPTISITAPSNGANLVQGATVAINATAADADGTVSQVQFFVDGVSVGIDATSPYSVNWTAVIGTHTITAVATDNNAATTTSATVSVTVISSSASYTIVSSANACDVSSICVPISAVVAVDNVKGYDVVVQYDKTKVQPSGIVTVSNSLVNPTYVSYASSNDAVNGKLNLSLYFNGSAPANAEFNGTGNVFCVEFYRTSGFGANDTAAFTVPTLQESYISGVQQKITNAGQATTSQNSIFTSTINFWSNGSALGYDGTGTTTTRTDIFGDSICANLSATAVQPNTTGTFTYDLAKGPAINIQRDIANTTSVQPVVNGFDAFLVRRLLINDATFIPSVYQLIASDVNLDGVVSAGDLSQINQRAVLILGEFQQTWNYNPSGTPLGPKSKDWLFIDQSSAITPAYQISTTFPLDNGVGYSKQRVPASSFCRNVPVLTGASGCRSFSSETYSGVLLGDVNGNFSTVGSGGSFKTESTDKVILDLSKAVYSNGIVEIPVTVSSADEINSIDFATKFDENKLAYSSASALSGNLIVLDNLNATDKTLRVTSNSLTTVDKTQSQMIVRFATSATQIDATDFNSTEAYLNGNPVSFEIGNSVSGIKNLADEVAISVYPNPATNVLAVRVSANANVQLMDVTGKQVIAQTTVNANEKQEINTESIASGVYLLKVSNNSFVTTKRVVVSK